MDATQRSCVAESSQTTWEPMVLTISSAMRRARTEVRFRGVRAKAAPSNIAGSALMKPETSFPHIG